MHLEKIEIINFRKFINLNLEFKPGVNILIGNNATGKTSILEAIKIALGGLFYGINSKFVSSPSIHKTKDVNYTRNEHGSFKRNYPTSINVEANVFNENIIWNRQLNTAKGSTTKKGLKELISLVKENSNGILPILAYYSTSRLYEGNKTSSSYKKDERYEAYHDALNAESSVSRFIKWFENEDRISYQNKKTTLVLELVSQAITNCIPKCKRVFYDSSITEIVVESQDGNIVPLSLMSDGYKIIISLIGDLSYRCAILNPQLGINCLSKISGVVLIDEIETHLHPSWQQRVINDLSKVFPLIQFIITTHSPIVLSATKAHVISFGEKSVSTNTFTYGRKPEYIMYSEQGVLSRTKDIQDKIDLFYLLIDKKDGLKEAKIILEDFFIAQFGESDPDTVRAKSDYEFALMEFDVEDSL